MSQVEIAQRSTRGSFALFAGNFLSTLVSFIAILFIARLLGPSNYGIYALCVLLPGVVLNFLGFGVNSAITRYVAYNLSQGNPEVARRMALVGCIFVLLFGAALSVVDFAISGPVALFVFHRPSMTSLLQFSSILILAQAIFQSGVSALLGWSHMGRIAGITIVQSVLRVTIVLPLLYLGYQVYGALFAYAASVMLGGILSYTLLWSSLGGTHLSRRQFVSDVKTLLSYGRDLFVGSLASNFAPQYVVVVLAIVASNAQVGYYQSASNFVTAITLTSGSITQALFPAFAHMEGTGSDITKAFKYAVKYMGFAITPVIFLLMGASLQMVRLPLGPSYVPAATFLALLSLSNISMLFGMGVLPSFFNGLGRPRYYMVFSMAGLLLLFCLAPVLAIIAGLGALGLILSILVSNVVATIVGLYLSSRFLGARLDLKACASILASSLAAYVAVLAASRLGLGDILLLPIEILLFLLVYLTAAPLTRAISSEDVVILSGALGGLGRARIILEPLIRYEALVLRLTGLDRRNGAH